MMAADKTKQKEETSNRSQHCIRMQFNKKNAYWRHIKANNIKTCVHNY